jgi:eukaryotic-like serine/threonine-protein kinase
MAATCAPTHRDPAHPSSGPGGFLLGGRYRLGELIGAGGVADVYRAVDERLGREAAVKVFRPGAAVAEGLDRYHAELRVLARLDHPGVIPLYDAGVEDVRPYLVMELVEGTTLAARLRNGAALPAGEVRRMGAGVADALEHVHARGVVHRDVKPANVLVDRTGAPRLADFGIALLGDGARFTAGGCIVGTAAYLAPEQTTDGPVAPPSDVYSLGLVLLECLTGRREYTGDLLQVALARLTRPPDVPGWLPDRWRDLLVAMTALEPADRPTAGEVADHLRGMDTVTVPDRPRGPATAGTRPDTETVAVSRTALAARALCGGGKAAALPALCLAGAGVSLALLGAGGTEPAPPSHPPALTSPSPAGPTATHPGASPRPAGTTGTAGTAGTRSGHGPTASTPPPAHHGQPPRHPGKPGGRDDDRRGNGHGAGDRPGPPGHRGHG